MTESRLERRYRFLLRAYPRSYREIWGDELLAVLLEDAAATSRSRLGARDAADLVRNGLRERTTAGLRDPVARRWVDALGVCTVVLTLALGARAGTYAATALWWRVGPAADLPRSAFEWIDGGWPAQVLWLVAAAALVLGGRRVAGAAAIVGTALQVAALVEASSSIEAQMFVLRLSAETAVTALLLTPGLAARGLRIIGRGPRAFVLAGLMLAGAASSTWLESSTMLYLATGALVLLGFGLVPLWRSPTVHRAIVLLIGSAVVVGSAARDLAMRLHLDARRPGPVPRADIVWQVAIYMAAGLGVALAATAIIVTWSRLRVRHRPAIGR